MWTARGIEGGRRRRWISVVGYLGGWHDGKISLVQSVGSCVVGVSCSQQLNLGCNIAQSSSGESSARFAQRILTS